jgi:RimJ/RimL family protein N-acetyltransferase
MSETRLSPLSVHLRPWSEEDYALLLRTNAPEMTEHLGGSETPEQLAGRHRRYLKLDGPGRMYRIAAADGTPVGTIGYWERSWQGETVWETGWGVFPEFQKRGVASAAARLVAAEARAEERHRHLHAYPSAGHAASNGVCRKAGFTLQGPCEFEYPKGTWMRCNDWSLELMP